MVAKSLGLIVVRGTILVVEVLGGSVKVDGDLEGLWMLQRLAEPSRAAAALVGERRGSPDRRANDGRRRHAVPNKRVEPKVVASGKSQLSGRLRQERRAIGNIGLLCWDTYGVQDESVGGIGKRRTGGLGCTVWSEGKRGLRRENDVDGRGPGESATTAAAVRGTDAALTRRWLSWWRAQIKWGECCYP
ncbi:hypothetical protein B0H13DRAFT_1895901 [Mycena leptocephala]|nr:hypothetical protein B0H13DRAFT_1895901 [Mycena leptocephala]